MKSKLVSRIIAGVLAGTLTAAGGLSLFLDEKEGTGLSKDGYSYAYRDGGGIWTICRGVTFIDGKSVTKGMKLSKNQCDYYNNIEAQKALAWVNRNIKYPLNDIQKIGIASFCPYNIGPAKCFSSTFYKKINSGDIKGACEQIPKWIYDGGKDCRIRSNNCAGQPMRRADELELCRYE